MASIARSPKPEKGLLEPENAPLNDAGIRLLLIPAFGIAIPHLTGYFGPLGPADAKYWIGLIWGCLISFTLWHGNRFFLIKQRQYFDWFQQPVRKLTALVFASVFYTAPCTVVMMLAWYQFAGFGPDWSVIRIIALACVICVLFITHIYETVYLIQQRESDLVAVERLERARTEAELDALKAQVTPHFLFNSLNTLSWLIENSPRKALDFNQNLAEVYRYILTARQRELVPLQEEMQFLTQYFDLLKIRFEESLDMQMGDPGDRAVNWYLPPISLQILVENAVKHNEHSRQRPLTIEILFGADVVEVANERRPRVTQVQASGMGLKTLDDRCRLVLGRGVDVEDEPLRFIARVPVRIS